MASVSWAAEAVDLETAKAERDAQREERPERRLLDEGYYNEVSLVDVSVQKSKAGDPQLKLTFLVEDQTLMTWVTFTENSTKWAVKDLLRLGIDFSGLEDPSVEADGRVAVDTEEIGRRLEALMDAECVFTTKITHEKYDGKMRARVNFTELKGAAPKAKVKSGGGF